jgi:hypothetical protein
MKPECSDYQNDIAKSLLGDLTAEENQALEAHLETCSQCRSEQLRFARTLGLLKSVEEEPVPRHFFVHPAEKDLTPWQSFRLMRLRWQAMTVAFAGLFLLLSGGWLMSLTRGEIDVAALKQDLLKTVEQKNQEARAEWIEQVRAEFEHSSQNLTQQQKADLKAALARLDTRITGRLVASESRTRDDAQKLATGVFKTVAQQRAQDLKLINLRFGSIEARNAIENRQTDEILGTLLQAAELRIR